MPHPTRIADDIVESARVEAEREGRSVAEQINHWARVGRNVSMHDSTARRRIEAAAAGTLPIGELTREEGRLFEAEASVKLQEMLDTTDLGAELAAEGMVTVALDEQGRIVEYHPDGTERVLSGESE